MKRTRARRRILLLVIPCAVGVPSLMVLAVAASVQRSTPVVRGEEVRYVDSSQTTGADNGTSWDDAYIYAQDALADARTNSAIGEIWVAAGTYLPDHGAGQTLGDQEATFELVAGVEMYGGFAGGESSLAERDIEANPTTLSGDLDGDDAVNFANYDENSHHVVTASGMPSTTVLDGFVISGGNALDSTMSRGGGLAVDTGNPTIARCAFEHNEAREGGAIYAIGARPTVTDCRFQWNR
ncbi:MAG: hypothetical protein GY842_19545, partial [bacterium]|nr:hypothetical protein [bacterium]